MDYEDVFVLNKLFHNRRELIIWDNNSSGIINTKVFLSINLRI